MDILVHSFYILLHSLPLNQVRYFNDCDYIQLFAFSLKNVLFKFERFKDDNIFITK